MLSTGCWELPQAAHPVPPFPISCLRGVTRYRPGMPERYEFVVVECRECARKVYRPVDVVPIASHARCRCRVGGHRGADLTRTWAWSEADRASRQDRHRAG